MQQCSYWSLKISGVGLNLCRDWDRRIVPCALWTALHSICSCITFQCTGYSLPEKKNQISTLDNLVLITPPEHWVEQIDTICQIFLHYKVTSRVTQMTLRPDTAVRCSHCRSQPQPSPHLSPSLPEWPQQQCSKCSNVTQNAIIHLQT